ncbi:hypothetical protein GLOTRDRAFT_136075 [Gloeophyllum trabeum ATCC 11539]|uniref:non-specific serine/threonine protein kinase n=1 Tax=Gloeophyllum trabeum (strain ATCC 11539 / FP-39264 / Madison 617) TaxID=670483 RepID=S7QIK3_GLOTA|nr:uncharacterized protein GLOTRDRAFT_136075 [Gloeophyllum trabeum ATCC 11539]EPQ59113.1 hypothetical protein GLOTRDRAFT_136075 [Gloeophyllum trabeum ATCC 11539]
MLGTRTKQVTAYGRRGQRIVSVSDRRSADWDEGRVYNIVPDAPKATRYIELHSSSSKSSPRAKRVQKTAKQLSPMSSSPSPVVAAKVIRKRQVSRQIKASPKAVTTSKAASPRPPLASVPPNSPAFYAGTKKKASVAGSKRLPPKPQKPHSPAVNMDIIVLDGVRMVSQERRVSRPDVVTNPMRIASQPLPRTTYRAPQPKVKSPPIVISDSEEEAEEIPQLKKRAGRRAKPTVISSDSDDSPSDLDPPKRSNPPPTHAPSMKLIFDEPPYHLPKSAPATFLTPVPHASKTHKLTPIRYRTAALFPHAGSPPSPTTPSDFDLSLELSDLAITPSAAKQSPPPPEYLRPLLAECCQDTPHEFSAFIETFPFDPVVRPLDTPTGPPVSRYEFRKIGEASYSEVFGIGDVVLKIIPLRDEEPQARKFIPADVETPPPSDAKDVLKEIIVTRAMGEMCDGFVKLLRTYVVRGRYPSLLLDLWDDFYETKGSESVRPDNFPVSQTYAIIVLPNGGPDLESYTFTSASKNGWRQACSVFWQVTRALAEAEDLVSFEHRDLHWGQILVKNTSVGPMRKAPRSKVLMDSPGHGVMATVIDLGLARMDAGDDEGVQTHWTPFDEEIFEGTGDYQFDIYRMMRQHIGKSWSAFRPLTNVMWLHYLTLKLLHSKRLKPPPVSRKTSTISEHTFTERECYECLVEVEKLLAAVVSPFLKPNAGQTQEKFCGTPWEEAG